MLISRQQHAGFTLLEILIVIVIMAVMAAFVVPSFMSLNKGSVDEEARRLVRVLKLAADESVLTGRVMRWSATEHSYYFETEDEKGQWQLLEKPPYQRYTLPEGIVILSGTPAPHSEEQGLRARFLLRSHVMMGSPLELVLSTTDEEPLRKTVRLEPSVLSLKINLVQARQ